MSLPNSTIDFFVYFSLWSVHHQVDWAFAKEIQIRSDRSNRVRFYNCSHTGDFPCAISRDFIPDNLEYKQNICNMCCHTYDDYFKDFEQALNIDIHSNVINDLVHLSEEINEAKILHYIESLDLLNEKMQASFVNLLQNIDSLSLTTAMTHFRMSKIDLLRSENNEKRVYFRKTLIIEALRILHNWSIALPDSVVIFNARLTPYCVPFYLAKLHAIPIYIHERGIYKPYSMFFNERPSAGKAKIRLIKYLNSFDNNLVNTITDQSLLEALTVKYNTLKKPKNFPNFYEKVNKLPKGISFADQNFDKIITYVVSSDDEADTEDEFQIGMAQRNIIKIIVDYSVNQTNCLFIIKVHPNIYGVNGYPGMNESIKFYERLENIAQKRTNLVVLGKDSEVNPYELVDKSDIVIGLHSSLMEYAWFIGKLMITYSAGILSNSTTFAVDYNNPPEVIELFDHLINTQVVAQKIDFDKFQDRLLYLVTGHYAFDIDIGEIKIAEDHFSPKLSANEISDNFNTLEKGDLSTLVDIILSKGDINYAILCKRLSEFSNLNR